MGMGWVLMSERELNRLTGVSKIGGFRHAGRPALFYVAKVAEMRVRRAIWRLYALFVPPSIWG